MRGRLGRSALLFMWASSMMMVLPSGVIPLSAQELRAVGQLRWSGPVTTEGSKKIVSRLRALIAEFGAAGITRENAAANGAAARYSSATLKVDDLGRVQVDVTLSDTGEAALATLRRHELDIEIVNRDVAIVQGWIPVENLERLADEAVVLKIRPPSYATPRTGPVNSQGDAIHRCDQVRASPGLTGFGVKVGVISDGVSGLPLSQAAGELPPAVQVLAAGSGDEGTAMLEIIHDCAPGAALAFATGSPTSLVFINAVNALKNAGAKIIVDDLGFFGEPFFQDGTIALNDRTVGAAVLRVSAGGNDRTTHYQGTFVPGPADPELSGTRHLFGPGDSLLRFRVGGNSSATVILQWANLFGAAADDYDLCIRQSGVLIACSADFQDGNDDPIETVTVGCPPGPPCARDIQITLFAGSPRLLKMFCLGNCIFDEFSVPAGSIIGHPAVPEVVAVAAADADTPTVTEPYSSEGPVTIVFPTTESRAKPDVTGIDCVSTSRPGFTTFCGTSAAAPHVAAVAALALEGGPGLTPLELRGLLKGTAIDLGSSGYDFASGFGRADAVNAVATAGGPVPPTLTVSLNASSFDPGDSLVVTATMTPGTLTSSVDAYIVLRAPDGSLLSLQLGPGAVPGIVPIGRGFVPFAFNGVVLQYPFGGGEMPGSYTWFSGLTEAGTMNVFGSVDADPFTFSP